MSAKSSEKGQPFAVPADWWLRLAHDLRGPIAPMRMAVQLLKSGRVGQEDRDDALQMIDRQIDQLLANIDDINDLLHLNAGTFALKLTAGDLNLVLDAVCGRSSMLKRLEEKQISLHCEPVDSPVVACHDLSRMTALVEFLVLKSAAHTAPGGALTLRLRSDDGHAEFLITGAKNSLAEDPELAHVAGLDTGVNADQEAKTIVMREIARLNKIVFTSIGRESGIALTLPLE